MKAKAEVGYSRTGNLRAYRYKSVPESVGIDGVFWDGLGNKIEVYVRERELGHRIVLNGTTIAEGAAAPAK